MAPSISPILVVGGGPSGLVSALTLLQNNVPVRIIDKAPDYHVGRRGSGIWPRTFDMFHFLRVPEIHQRGQPPLPMQEYKPGTVEVVTKTAWMTTQKDPTPSIPYMNLKLISQSIQEGILRSHLAKYGCFVELGTELQSFEDDGERVLAKLVKRKDGEEVFETFKASYLIGADGAKWVTRKQLGLTFLGETKGFAFATGDICVEIEAVDREHWHFFGRRSPGCDFLMLSPTAEIGPDGFQFAMSSQDYEPRQLIADEKLLIECMSETIGREAKIRKVVVMSEFRPNIRMVDKFSVGRVFVAGDAAHVHSPTGGQGLNSSVQDALNLCWKLALVYKALSPATLLDSYNAERLPIISEMLDITTSRLQQLHEAQTIDRAIQHDDRLSMLGVNCRTSPIVVDEFATAEPVNAYRVLDESVLVAGDRAPDAPELVGMTGAKTRLFDVFGATHHTVLTFAPDVAFANMISEALKKYDVGDLIQPLVVLPRTCEVTAGRAQANVVVDRGGHAYHAYLAKEGEQKVVVVRPDGVVGAIVHGVEGVVTYFSRVFVQ